MLPPDMLRATWGKMTSDLGEFVAIKWAGHEQKQDLDYVYVTCHFSRKDIDLLFIFDAFRKLPDSRRYRRVLLVPGRRRATQIPRRL